MQAAFLPQVYFDAVTASGGIAVLLPPQPDPRARGRRRPRRPRRPHPHGRQATCSPSCYGQSGIRSPTIRAPDRDAWELALFRGADERRMPVLAICRGLPARECRARRHAAPAPARGARHRAVPARRRRLRDQRGRDRRRARRLASPRRATATSTCTATTTRASTELGDGLVVTARTDDGLIAGVRVRPATDTCVGVQWHPEEDAEDRRLFAGLVAAGIDLCRYAHELGSDVVSGSFTVDQPGHRRSRSARCRARASSEVDAAIARAVVARSGPGRRSRPLARADALRALRARRRGARRGARAARGAQLGASDRLGALGGVARRAGAQLLRRVPPSG